MKIAYNQSQNLSGGRVTLLLLLFGIAIWQLINSGFSSFAVVCIIPVVIFAAILTLRKGMTFFWALLGINYVLQWKCLPSWPFPMSLPNEVLEILLLILATIDVKNSKFERTSNVMMLALLIWATFIIIEAFNNTCDLGYQIGAWYAGARMMCFQLIYAHVVYVLYIKDANTLVKYLYVWGALSLFAAFWVWKQQYIGLTASENAFLQGRGRHTHILNGGTLIRLFSVYSDAASFGIGIASTAVAFLIFGVTAKIKKLRIYFLIVGLACAWAMFPSGTRTAIFCLFAGFAYYVVISKSIKIAIPVGITFLAFYFILAFTTIGSGYASIRRMRSAFNRNDASANVRTINQAVMKKYLADAPFGLGIGMGYENVPANNKFRKLATIPPDSEYVFIWIHAGYVGITVFLICTFLIICGASQIVLFRLRSPSLRGIGAGLTCAFISMQLGGYGNQVLMQFPNCLLFYGGISIVFILPYIEDEWIAYEKDALAVEDERKRLKKEKKRAKRV